MDEILIGSRLLLSAIFLIAGTAKLADREGSIRAAGEFGIPQALSVPVGMALPWAELLVAISLIPAFSAWYGALAAFVLLAGFIAAIGINLSRGHTPDCHCFGQLHSAPAGWSTLTRNAVLALLALTVVAQGPAGTGPSAVAWIADLSVGQRLLSAAATTAIALLASQSFLLFQVLRQQGRLLSRMDVLEVHAPVAGEKTAVGNSPAPVVGIPIGSPAPAVRLKSLDGRQYTLQSRIEGGRPSVIAFVNPGCGPCSALLPEIARWQRELTAINFLIVSDGTSKENRAYAEKHGASEILLQEKRELAVALRANGTPAAVIVGPDGTIGSGVAFGVDAIRTLVARALGLLSETLPAPTIRHDNLPTVVPPRPALKPIAVGEKVPAIELASLDGNVVALPSLHGERTLLLFWNTGCGFCRHMLDELRAWESDPPPGAPRLVVISAGSTDDVRAMKLRSMVLLESDHRTAAAFGANGTPMAVLLDAEARVASSVAAGGPAVLALAAGTPAVKGNGAIPNPEPVLLQ